MSSNFSFSANVFILVSLELFEFYYDMQNIF